MFFHLPLPALATGFFSASLAFRCSFRVFPFCGVLEAELPGDEEDAPETVPVPPSFFVLTGWAEPGTKSCAATWGFILGFLVDVPFRVSHIKHLNASALFR
jgi:hypothetical protein